MNGSRFHRYALLFSVVACCASCTAPRPPLVVTDDDPGVKIPAISKAVREHDQSVIPQLIRELDNDDAAVRIYAIHALRDLTGERLGYEPYLDEDHRKASIERWKKWLIDHPVTGSKR